jgi:toxin HigB-1
VRTIAPSVQSVPARRPRGAVGLLSVKQSFTFSSLIRSFRSKGLRDFFLDDNPRGIRADLVERVRARLQALHQAKAVDDLRLPNWRLHALRGRPLRFSIAVNGPWRITFEWVDGDAARVDLEQYH